jgi:FtsH-binding integral membrane protein
VTDPDDSTGEASVPAAGRGPTMVRDVAAYLIARLLLAAVLAVAIYFLGRVLSPDFPVTVAVLFAIVLAFPLGIWIFAALRHRATASIAAFDERRRVERDQLRARLRGDEPTET